MSKSAKSTKRAPKKAAAPSVAHTPWLVERLKNPKLAAAYLEAAIEDGDQGGIMLALCHLAALQAASQTPEVTLSPS